MATPRFAWGIDIGNRALKAIKLIRDGDVIRVDDFDVIEHETVLSNAGDNREMLVNRAISEFSSRHALKGGAVAVGVSGQASFARFIKLPPVEEKKIPEIVRFEAIQQIPFPLDDVEWSYQLFRSEESPDVEVGIFAMRKELIDQQIKNFTDADLNVQVVQMNPLAVYNAMTVDQRIEGTTMIIDLGAENTDLIIADSETVWLRSIPIGGNNFTEALVKSFKLNFAKAEDLKRNAATSKYARQIFQAMRPVFADLVAEVQRSIGFYASVHRDSRIKKIVAVGGTFKLPGLTKYLQQNLQLEVERLDTIGAGAPPDTKQAATYQDNILSLVSSYGLALQAMGEGKITSSLLPARIRRERLWQDKTKYFAAAAALFVVGTGIGFGSIFLGQMNYDKVADERQLVDEVKQQATELDTQWTEISSRGGPDKQRILNIRSMIEGRDTFLQILAAIRSTVPVLEGPPEAIKKTPRDQRKQVLIDTINSIYFPDLAMVGSDLTRFRDLQNAASAAPSAAAPGLTYGFGAAAPGAAPAGADPMMEMPEMMDSAMDMGAVEAPVDGTVPAGGRGYVIRIAGTTPYRAAAQLLNESIVRGLAEKYAKEKATPGQKWAVEKVQVIYLLPLKDDQQKLQEIKTAFDAAVNAKASGQFQAPAATGGFGGFGGGFDGGGMMEGDMMEAPTGFGGFGGFPNAGAAAPVAPEERAYKDRVFQDEEILEDQQFIAVAVVELDPAAAPPAGEEGAEGDVAADPAAEAPPQ
jgi:type IV pilus assembly protein PilM